MLKVGFTKKSDLDNLGKLKGFKNPKEPNRWYAQFLEWNVNWLIISLYDIDEDTMKSTNGDKLKKYGLEDEPVNWGDLRCYDVETTKDKYIVRIEEASPNADKFKEYIQEWLQKWGWDNVEVITEW